MLLKILAAIAICAAVALSTSNAQAGGRSCPSTDACAVLRAGHVRGRLPIACVSIPYVKEGYGQVALFVLRDFNPNDTDEGIQEQLTRALFKDSKITGPIDDFCRNPRNFAGGNWIVLCDEHHWGSITGESLRYAMRHGRPPHGGRVHIGTGV